MKTRMALVVILSLAFSVRGQHLPEKYSGGSEIMVIVFLSMECPISQKYIPVLNELRQRYSARAVEFQAVIPGPTRKRDIRNFISDYNIQFRVSADKRLTLVKALSATTTPEAFVFNREKNLMYQGAIDNWFYELGGYRVKTTAPYLSEAIDALLAGGAPEMKRTKALGCSIEIPE